MFARNLSVLRGLALALGAALPLLVGACEDDETLPSDQTDASPPQSDAGDPPRPDAEPPNGDAASLPLPAVDAATDADAADASGDGALTGPTVLQATGVVGALEITPAAVSGLLFGSGVSLRMSDSTECLAMVRANDAAPASIGALSLTGGVIGMPALGGVAQSPLQVVPAATTFAYDFYDGMSLVFDPSAGAKSVVVSSAGAALPALPTTTLATPAEAMVTVSKPVLPATGPFVLDSAAARPVEFQWTPPTGSPAPHFIVEVRFLAQGTGAAAKQATLSCQFPLARGTGTLPTKLIEATRAALGGVGSDGNLVVDIGERRIVGTTPGSGYLLEALGGGLTTVNFASTVTLR